MYGAILGDLAGFPFEYRQEDLTDREIPLWNVPAGSRIGSDQAGEIFSEKTVLTAALQDGLLRFEKKIPGLFQGKSGSEESKPREEAEGSGKEKADPSAGELPDSEKGKEEPSAGGRQASVSRNTFEQTAASEIEASMRRFGGLYPLAGYAMDLSVWLFREGTGPAENEDPGPAARVSPIAWIFQEDLYMMRRMAVLQAGLTNTNRETLKAADAAACMVFLSIHGCTKDYIAGYLEKGFGYRTSDFEEMKKEILYADFSSDGIRAADSGPGDGGNSRGGQNRGSSSASEGTSIPALCVRAALTAFLYGRDFEDVIRRAVSLCGSRIDTAAVTSIAGAAAEAFFGIPDELRERGRKMLPEQIREAADAFFNRVEEKKKARELVPELKARWESALTRATRSHPAAVQGNEELERAIDEVLRNKDQQSLSNALRILRRRAAEKGRVYVPATAVKRPEKDITSPVNGDRLSPSPGAEKNGAGDTGNDTMTYRLQAVRTRDGRLWQPAFTSREQLETAGAGKGIVLSYSITALLARFLSGKGAGQMPDEIMGVVLNPGGRVLFLPRVTIGAVIAGLDTEGPSA